MGEHPPALTITTRPIAVDQREAARLLGLPLSTFQQLDPGPRKFTVGRRKVLYAVADLEAWVREQTERQAG